MRRSFLPAPLWVSALFALPMVSLPAFAVWAVPQKRIGEAVLSQAPDRYSFPLLFVPNRGQWSAELAFTAQAAEADVLFSDRDAVIVLPGEGGGPRPEVRISPMGAAPTMRVTHGEQLPTRVSYYRGSDRAKWVAAVPTYDSIWYRAAYPGIDLSFRGDGPRLAYDFFVQPGADPSQIQMAVEGVEGLTLASDGSLVMTLPDGRELRQRAPVAYQVIGDERVLVEGRFEILVPCSGETEVSPFPSCHEPHHL